MSSAAQDEFDALYNNNQDPRLRSHPEDRSDSSDNDSTTLHSGNEDERTLTSNSTTAMPHATTYLPTTTQFDANTGPKGVIADARSFETAKKRSFRQTLYAFSNSFSREKSKSPSPEVSADDEEDDFMRQWRANRIDELSRNNQDIRTRRQSPSQRRYGSLVTVDPSGYLDAVEKVHAYTTVVVLIYDDEVRTLYHMRTNIANEDECSQQSATKSRTHSRSLREIMPLHASSNSMSSTLRWTRSPRRAFWLTKLVNALRIWFHSSTRFPLVGILVPPH